MHRIHAVLRLKRKIEFSFFAIAIFASCARPDLAAPKFEMSHGDNLGVGHEAVTYHAQKLAASLAKESKKKAFMAPKTSGIIPAFKNSTVNATDPFVIGNAATDWIRVWKNPSVVVFNELYQYYKNKLKTDWKNGESWNNEPNLYSLHFLRNEKNRTHVSSKDFSAACEDSHTHIAMATSQAMAAWGNTSLAQKWMGSALHTIQDSFSAEHTRREFGDVQGFTEGNPFVFPAGDESITSLKDRSAIEASRRNALGDFRRVRDMCTYGVSLPAIACTHDGSHEQGDHIWIDPSGSWEPSNLKPNALGAIWASYVYISTVYDNAENQESRIDLTRFFDVYMKCN